MMNDGNEWIVDIDLEKFFDTVNHDKLMTIIGRTIKDGDVISIVRKYLVSGIMIDDEYEDSIVGTPQGGNLSPLLANIMLNELDSNSYKVMKLNQLIRGWINYFKIGSMKTLCKEMDARIRCRLRMCIWKQWKTPQNRINNLIKLGVDKDTARITAYTGNRIAYVCQRRVMNFAINKERLTRFGLVSMLDYYTERCVTC